MLNWSKCLKNVYAWVVSQASYIPPRQEKGSKTNGIKNKTIPVSQNTQFTSTAMATVFIVLVQRWNLIKDLIPV